METLFFDQGSWWFFHPENHHIVGPFRTQLAAAFELLMLRKKGTP